MEGTWAQWMANPVLRALLVVLFLAGVATILGLMAFWPDGSGRAAIEEESAALGLRSLRYEATVDSVADGECDFSTEGNEWECRLVVVVPADGPDAGTLLALPELVKGGGPPVPEVEPGDRIIIDYEPATQFYSYADQDRRSSLLILAVLFAVVVVLLGRMRGVLALTSMAVTVVILVGFVAPSVLDGNDPVAVSVVAASIIAFCSLYLTHGVTPTTTVALIGTLLALLLVLVLSSLFFDLARFTGLATEEGLLVPIVAENINMASLLLGGAMIGALGALDDVTVTQVATVAELRAQSPEMSRGQLYSSGVRVGREHIAATVNTLLLAYAGVSMPLLLLFVISNQSLGMIANSEIVAVEIVRTLCGSMGLIAAVPITTWLTAALVAAGAPSDADQPVEESGEVDRPVESKAYSAQADDDPDGRAAESASSDVGDAEAPPSPWTRNVHARWEDFAPDESDETEQL